MPSLSIFMSIRCERNQENRENVHSKFDIYLPFAVSPSDAALGNRDGPEATIE